MFRPDGHLSFKSFTIWKGVRGRDPRRRPIESMVRSFKNLPRNKIFILWISKGSYFYFEFLIALYTKKDVTNRYLFFRIVHY